MANLIFIWQSKFTQIMLKHFAIKQNFDSFSHCFAYWRPQNHLNLSRKRMFPSHFHIISHRPNIDSLQETHRIINFLFVSTLFNYFSFTFSFVLSRKNTKIYNLIKPTFFILSEYIFSPAQPIFFIRICLYNCTKTKNETFINKLQLRHLIFIPI